jgi:hypothetical protein
MSRSWVFIISGAILLPLGCRQQVLSEKPSEKLTEKSAETTTTKKMTEVSTETVNVSNEGDYRYKIRTMIDTSSNKKIPLFVFSRPLFEGTHGLVTVINKIYDEAEKEFSSETVESDWETSEFDYYRDPDYPCRYKVLSDCTYEKDDIVSFTSNYDWYMGGVHNSWKEGHTFDFALGRELKIGDILIGDESQITATLEKEFSKWFEETEKSKLEDIFDSKERRVIAEQSGAEANFYLAEDGVHIFYSPYVLSATQNGVDILIPWERTDLLQPCWT